MQVSRHKVQNKMAECSFCDLENNENNAKTQDNQFKLSNYKKKAKPISPKIRLIENLKNLITINNYDWTDDLLQDVPKKWKLFDDLVLLPYNCFNHSEWMKIGI